MIKYPKKLDYKKFKKDTNNNETRYGLPEKVLYCKKCVISNQRPNSTIEFLSNKQKKKTIKFDQMVFVMHAIFL